MKYPTYRSWALGLFATPLAPPSASVHRRLQGPPAQCKFPAALAVPACSALALFALPASAAVVIDYVPIGNAGNAPDPDATGNSFGAVPYDYSISRNETTISQYAEFLNAVAKTDTYSLYNPGMVTTTHIAGITQSGSPGTYTYSVAQGSGDKPITYVTWFDAARFTNWLHNGQPTGVQSILTTEDGAYTLNGAMSGIITKNVNATVWIPSEDEWYKAAYYDPNKGGQGVGGYWAEATQSDTLAGNTIGAANSANFYDGDYVGYPTMSLTNVGAYGGNSQSAYGTNDQAGNLIEWNDAVINGTRRGLRGGAFLDDATRQSASYRDSTVPTNESNFVVGFRVAGAIPEPSAALLILLSATPCLMRRRRSSL